MENQPSKGKKLDRLKMIKNKKIRTYENVFEISTRFISLN